MARFEALDEADIAASPAEVIAALDDEAAGRSSWWLPWLRLSQRGTRAYSEVGGEAGIAVNGKGRLDRRWGTAHFECRVVAVDPERRIAVEYVGGDFRGTGEWRFDKVDETHTHVAFRWSVNPAGLMRLWSRLVNLSDSHSRVMWEGFAGLENYVAARRVRGKP